MAENLSTNVDGVVDSYLVASGLVSMPYQGFL